MTGLKYYSITAEFNGFLKVLIKRHVADASDWRFFSNSL